MKKTETYTLPKYYACYLMYGDFSGLTEDEIKQIDRFVEREKLGWLVNISEESYFKHFNDLDNLGNDVCEYTFEVNE